MRDFLDHLDRKLATLAIGTSGETIAAPPHQQQARRRPFLAGSAVAVVATCTGVFAMTGTSTAGLPILSTPTTDATAIRDTEPTARKASVDFSKAHAFQTPAGPGYVLVDPSDDALCLAVPDPNGPGDYGTECVTRRRDVERDGLMAAFPGDRAVDPQATALTVFLLPEGAEEIRLTVDGKTSNPAVASGIAVMQLPTEGTLQWVVDGQPAKRTLEGPFPATGGLVVECPDGRRERIADPAPRPSRREFRQAKAKACAR